MADPADIAADGADAELVLGADIPRPLTTVEAVLEAYVEANGGRKGLEAVRSLRMRGQVEERGQTYIISLVKKRPNFKRLNMEQGSVYFSVSSDGTTGWKQTRSSGQTQIQALGAADLANILSDGDFDGPLVDGGPGVRETRLVGTARLGRTPCYVIEIARDKETTRYIIDARTFRELRSISTAQGVDGKETIIESRMYDYIRAGGIWVAKRIERWSNGALVSKLSIESVEVNPGVLDNYFAQPAS